MMKKIILGLSILMAVSHSQAATVNNKSPQKDQFSYSYGYAMGKTYADILKDIYPEAFLQGLQQGALGQKTSLTDEEMAKALAQYKQQSEAKQLIAFQQTAQENGKLGEAFLAENAKKSGIMTTKSGLQYQIVQTGQGKKPTVTSKVSVNYEGRLLDGTVFDSSIARGQPVDFQVSQVISGWTEGLQLMQEGAKYRFFIPAKLAYGDMGAGDSIGPNSTLIFDVELLKILP